MHQKLHHRGGTVDKPWSTHPIHIQFQNWSLFLHGNAKNWQFLGCKCKNVALGWLHCVCWWFSFNRYGIDDTYSKSFFSLFLYSLIHRICDTFWFSFKRSIIQNTDRTIWIFVSISVSRTSNFPWKRVWWSPVWPDHKVKLSSVLSHTLVQLYSINICLWTHMCTRFIY